MLELLLSPIGRAIGGVGALLFGASVLYGAGFYKGDVHRAKVDDAAGARAKIEWLQTQLDARDASAKQEAEQAKIDTDALTQRLEDANHAVAKVSPGVCLDGNDADGLRSLWDKPDNRKH